MATLTRMTSSIEGIEKRMEKVDMVQQKEDNLATWIESMEKKEIEKSQDRNGNRKATGFSSRNT